MYKNRGNIVHSKSPHTHYPDSTIINILPELFKTKSKNCNLFVLQLVQPINKHLLRGTGKTRVGCARTMCQALGLPHTGPFRSSSNSVT